MRLSARDDYGEECLIVLRLSYVVTLWSCDVSFGLFPTRR